jgi:hypothetical protein
MNGRQWLCSASQLSRTQGPAYLSCGVSKGMGIQIRLLRCATFRNDYSEKHFDPRNQDFLPCFAGDCAADNCRLQESGWIQREKDSNGKGFKRKRIQTERIQTERDSKGKGLEI